MVESNVDKPRLLPSQNQRGSSCSCISCAMWSTPASYLPGSLTDTLPPCSHNPSEIKAWGKYAKRSELFYTKCEMAMIMYFKYCRILTN